MNLTYRPSFNRTFFLVASCLVFVFVGILMQILPPPNNPMLFPWNESNQKIIGWLIIAFLISGASLFIYVYIKGVLILQESDFKYTPSNIKVSWVEVENVEPIDKNMGLSVKWLGVCVKPEFKEKYAKFEKLAKKANITKYDIIINLDSYSKDTFDKIIEEFNKKIGK